MSKSNFYKILLASLFLSIFSCSSDSNEKEEQQQLDTINPTISCIDPINAAIDASASNIEVTYTTPEGIDNTSAITTQTAGLASGASFPVGTTTNTFTAKDPSGNTTSCSFDVVVTRNAASENKPYFIGSDPTPSGKKWTKVENLSDEFNVDTFDDTKWHRNAATDGFNWIGRAPGLFESENVSASDGNMNVTTLKFDTPKIVNGKTFTHGGAIVRSKATAKQGQFYECRMKANKTIMSSTFWIAFKQNCNTGPVRKLELDIQECVGRVHSGTPTWAQNFDNIFHSNSFRHFRSCDTENTETQQIQGAINLSEKNHSRFFVYGCWWKSPTEMLFYIDGEYAYSITPPTDFDLEGHITMAIETYDWNPVDEAGSLFETGSFDDLTTKYDWIRTWKLDDQ